jgi:predicted alpha/beta hydrolase family esterase
LPDPQAPVLATWLAALRETLAGLPDAGFDVVAHSLGAVLWLHHVAEPDGSPRPARVALVAPPTATPLPSGAPPIPSPAAAASEIAEYFPVPLDVDVVRHAAEGTVLVGGDDDPYAPEGVAAAYGRPLKMATTVLAGGGHINAESGFDEWPAMLSWCNRDNLAFY